MPGLPEQSQTLVYSTVDGHDIRLDYHLPRDAAGALPAIVVYHGGGMTAGSRKSLDSIQWLIDGCQSKHYILIAPDYRLCHPCTALDQIADVKALFQYLSHNFSSHLPGGISLDTKRIAVAGFSAGAYSARAACIYAGPKPAALMTAYGLGGDLLLDHWTAARPPTTLAKFVDLDKVPGLLADEEVVSEDNSPNRFAITVKWELDGTCLDGWFGYPGLGARLNAAEYRERERLIPPELKPGFPQLFVGMEYPPSVFVHGTDDEVVPPEESKAHHDRLKSLGIKTELLLVKAAGHGLVDFNTGPPPQPAKGAEMAYQKAFDFLVEAFEAVR